MNESQINIRVNDMTRRQIDELVEITGMSITELITLAVDRVYSRQQGINIDEARVSLEQLYSKCSEE